MATRTSKNNNFARAAHFFAYFFAVFADYDVKIPIFDKVSV